MNHMTAVVIAAIALCCLLMEQSDTESHVSAVLKSTNGAFAFAMIHPGIHAGNGIAAREDTTKEKWKREKEEALLEKIKNKPTTPIEESDHATETGGGSWEPFACFMDMLGFCFEVFGDDEEEAVEEGQETEGDLTTSPDAGVPPSPDAGVQPSPDADVTPSPDAGVPPSPDAGVPPSSERPDEQTAAEAESPYPYAAIVIPVAMNEVEIAVWDKPGGAEAEASVVTTMPQSTEVTVLEGITIDETTWLRIETMEKPKVSGWILEEETVSFEQP